VAEKITMKADAKHEDAARAARAEKLRRRFPTIAELRRRARWRVPRFAFDFVDGGANDEECARRNATALSAVELLPRYCIDTKSLSTEVELFGRRYAAPFGVAPMGSGGLMWPGAEEYLAREAQRREGGLFSTVSVRSEKKEPATSWICSSMNCGPNSSMWACAPSPRQQRSPRVIPAPGAMREINLCRGDRHDCGACRQCRFLER